MYQVYIGKHINTSKWHAFKVTSPKNVESYSLCGQAAYADIGKWLGPMSCFEALQRFRGMDAAGICDAGNNCKRILESDCS